MKIKINANNTVSSLQSYPNNSIFYYNNGDVKIYVIISSHEVTGEK